MTFILKPNLRHCTKNEVSSFSCSQLTAWTDTQTNRQPRLELIPSRISAIKSTQIYGTVTEESYFFESIDHFQNCGFWVLGCIWTLRSFQRRAKFVTSYEASKPFFFRLVYLVQILLLKNQGNKNWFIRQNFIRWTASFKVVIGI